MTWTFPPKKNTGKNDEEGWLLSGCCSKSTANTS